MADESVQLITAEQYASSLIGRFGGDGDVTYILNKAPFTRYIWNGSALVGQPVFSDSTSTSLVGPDGIVRVVGAGSYLSGTKFAFLGNSTTVGTGSSNAGTTAWVPVFKNIVGGLIANDASVNAGVAGERTRNMLARMDALLEQDIQVLLVAFASINDAIDGVPVGSATDANSVNSVYSNVRQIIEKAQAVNCRVILTTDTPRDSGTSAAIQKSLAAYAIAYEALAVKYGCRYVDCHTPLADPATGFLLASMNFDGLHPNDLGHYTLAFTLANAVLADNSIIAPRLVRSPNAINHVSNPLMQGGSTLPTGYSQSGFSSGTAAVYSTVAPGATSRCKNGKMLNIAITALADSAVVVEVPITGTANTGDTVALSYVLEIEDTSGNFASLGCEMNFYWTAGGVIKGGNGSGLYIRASGPTYTRFTQDAAGNVGTFLWLTAKNGWTGVVRIGELGLINETQAGIAA